MVPSTQSQTGAAASAPTLLVVEDEPLIRMDLADCLRAEGFSVVEASGPGEAREVLSSGLSVACVLTDLHMPHRDDGLGLLRWLAAERPELPVFVASGVPDSLKLARKENEAIVAAFDKPYHANMIAAEVRAMLARETHA